MPKEWILNMATNRWGLNKKENVGPVSLWIRECAPKKIEDWKNFYYMKLSEMLEEKNIPFSPQEYLEDLGRRLYVKITEVIKKEIDDVNEEDCIKYIYELVIDRTYKGYKTEIETIYGQLQNLLGITIHPAPDKWDRYYNIDFYIEIDNKYVGFQIKPITYEQTPQIYKWKDWLSKTHEKFQKDKGGKVFIIFSIKKGNKKEIYNKEVIDEIKEEIKKLKGFNRINK